MNITLKLNSEELNYSLIDTLKLLYKNKEIEICVSDSNETDYLSKNPSNLKNLLENIKSDKNVVFNSLEDFLNEIRV